jgi:hypothetical protein
MVACEIPQLSPAKTKTLRALWTLFKLSPKYKKDQDGMGINVTDYSYCRYIGHFKQIAQKIQHAIPYSVGKPSLHNIMGVLKNLGQLPFKGRTHIPLDDYREIDPDYFNYDTYSVPRFPKDFSEVVAFMKNNGTCDIHMDVFRDIRTGKSVNIIHDAVSKMTHKKTLSRRIVTGVPRRCEKTGVINEPQFMEVMKLEKNPGKNPPMIKNANQESNGVKELMNLSDNHVGYHDQMVMNMDTDTWAWSCRCINRLHLEQVDAVEFHPRYVHDTLKCGPSMVFPDDLRSKTNNQQVIIKATDSMEFDVDELIHRAKRRKLATNVDDIHINN